MMLGWPCLGGGTLVVLKACAHKINKVTQLYAYSYSYPYLLLAPEALYKNEESPFPSGRVRLWLEIYEVLRNTITGNRLCK